MTTAAAMEALSDETLPFMGIYARESHLFLASVESPFPSLPMTSADGNLKSIALNRDSPAMSIPVTQTPCFLPPSHNIRLLPAVVKHYF